MTATHHSASTFLARLLATRPFESIRNALAPKIRTLAPLPRAHGATAQSVDERWQRLGDPSDCRTQILDGWTSQHIGCFENNVENMVGTVKVPVGLAGPLRVNGLFAQGDYFVPLATTEAALVASYGRGANLISEAGGASSALINEGVSRAPGFAFASLSDAGEFVAWVLSHLDELRNAAEATTRHGKLIDIRISIEGNHVYLNLDYTTGEASGQNMVTIATEALCKHLVESCPIRPDYHFVEANFSGDKKASSISFLGVRGKKVTAEVVVPAELIAKRLHTNVDRMLDYWRMSVLGGVMSGTIGVHGHYANGLAALYIATGQDAACVAESAVGVTRFEKAPNGALYASVTLPNLMLGTVGGGTGLPSQRACLDLIGLPVQRPAAALAEIAAAICLAGELSIIGALSAGHFSRAHQHLARKRAGRQEAVA